MHSRLTWSDTSGPGVVFRARKGPFAGWVWISLTLSRSGGRRRIRKGGSIRLF